MQKTKLTREEKKTLQEIADKTNNGVISAAWILSNYNDLCNYIDKGGNEWTQEMLNLWSKAKDIFPVE
jgi:hypothetical protein